MPTHTLPINIFHINVQKSIWKKFILFQIFSSLFTNLKIKYLFRSLFHTKQRDDVDPTKIKMPLTIGRLNVCAQTHRAILNKKKKRSFPRTQDAYVRIYRKGTWTFDDDDDDGEKKFREGCIASDVDFSGTKIFYFADAKEKLAQVIFLLFKFPRGEDHRARARGSKNIDRRFFTWAHC